MEFDLSDDHRLLRATVREFAEQEIAPVAEELDRTKAFPYDIVRRLGELDLMGIPFPEEYGGAGGDSLAYALAVEELTRVDSSVAITLCAHTSLGTQPIYLFGSEEQKREWMPRLCSGERLGAFGLTEPEAGSDAGNTHTRARLEDGEWVINGSKQFITNAGTEISGVVVITAVTGGDGNGNREISNILVENGTHGYEPGPPYRKMGWNASDTRPLSFDDCRVPAENIVGERGGGLKQFLTVLDIGRIGVAAMGVGLAQGAFDQALAYAKERRVRAPDRIVPDDSGPARRHLGRDRRHQAARSQGRVAEGHRPVVHPHRRPGEAQERPARGPRHRGSGADPWRVRIH
jgi:short/branched chain acyl-CoA dehydrogenase